MARSRSKDAASSSRDASSKAARKPDTARTRTPKRAGKAPKSLLLRDIPDDVLDVLRTRAERSGRSLQQELHAALRRGTMRNFDEARTISSAWHERLRTRDLPDSTELIREDRER